MSAYLHTAPPPRRKAPAGRNRPLEEVEQEAKSRRRPRAKGGRTWRLKSVLLYPLLLAGVGVLAVAGNSYLETMPLKDIQVELTHSAESAFINADDLKLGLQTTHGNLLGTPLQGLDLAALEQTIRTNPTVKDAEVYKSLLGVLHVNASLREAVGRLVSNSGLHLYIDAEGNKFPVSPRHTAYVPLIRGDFDEAVADTFACSTIPEALPVINFIQQHPFWREQISEIVIYQDGELELHTEVGDMPIEFGIPVRIEEKFQNLMDFYRQVVPEVGWKKYRSLSVKYRGQVVARKR